MSTGFSRSDAQSDFSRARRRHLTRRLLAQLRREPDDVDLVLPFEEVVAALGVASRRHVGIRPIPLEAIVGSVDRTRDFDRSFRPTSARTRPRWERLAAAARRGEPIPPISVYAISELYFVRDGHHRVSVARALGRTVIDADITEVVPRVGAGKELTLADLPLKGHERVFRERVPLPAAAAARIELSDPWRYAALAEGVEAWGFRAMQQRREFMSREAVARAWFEQDFEPIVASLRQAGLVGGGTDAEAYMRVVTERYRLMRTHEWNEAVVDRLRRELR